MDIREPSHRQSEIAARIDVLTAELRAVVADLRPEDIPLSWTPEVLNAFVEAERAATAGRLLVTARAAEADLWKRKGFTSPADWLSFEQGTSTGRARAELTTSERLKELGPTRDALCDGRLSADEAGVIADAAVVNPAAEEDLVKLSEDESLRKLREEAARRKAEAESEEAKRRRDERVRRERKVRTYSRDGAGHLLAVGPMADIAEIAAALDRMVDKQYRRSTPQEQREGRDAAAFDALTKLARGGGSAGEGTRRVAAKRLMLVRVDLAALVRGHVAEGEVCEIAGMGPISVAEMRRLVGDSALGLILTNGEAVVDVVNLNRKPTVAQELAKLWTDPQCSVLGCNRTVGLEFDHRADWALTRTTTVDQLDRLCGHHHDLKTYEGWRLEAGEGRRKMVPPSDSRGRTSAVKRQNGAGAGTRVEPSMPTRPGALPGRPASAAVSPNRAPGAGLSGAGPLSRGGPPGREPPPAQLPLLS